MTKEEFFKNIMNSLFSKENKLENGNESREKTLEEYKIFFNKKGIYVIKKPDNFEITILEIPDGPTSYKTKILELEKEEFGKKLNSIQTEYLYIGKTSAEKGLRGRLHDYIRFGYAKDNTNIKHYGGYYLWFIKDNKKLYANYATLEEIEKNNDKEIMLFYENAKKIFENKVGKIDIPEIIEMGLIGLHDVIYNYAPFANHQEEPKYKSYKDKNNSKAIGYIVYTNWEKYWKSRFKELGIE